MFRQRSEPALPASQSQQHKWFGGALILLVILTGLAKWQEKLLLPIDRPIIAIVQKQIQPVPTFGWHLLSVAFQPTLACFYILLLAIWLWWQRRTRMGVAVLIMMISGTMANHFLKGFIARPRPQIRVIIPEAGFSFPSGHTFGITLCLLILYFVLIRPLPRRLWHLLAISLCVLLIIGMAIARVYLGDHYPSDTLGGFLFALLWFKLCQSGLHLANRFYHRQSVQPRHAQHDTPQNTDI